MRKGLMTGGLLVFMFWLWPTEVMAGGDNTANKDWRSRMDSCSQLYKSNSDEDLIKYVACLWTGGVVRTGNQITKTPAAPKFPGINQTTWNGLMNKGCDPGSSWRKSGYWACFAD